MAQLELDKEKYFLIAKEKGVKAALTELHHEKEYWEIQTFEGQDGYQPALWKFLEEIRAFSRELWALDLENENKRAR